MYQALGVLSEVRQNLPHDAAKHISDLVFLCLASASGYFYRVGKNWYQRGSTPDRQAVLCLEAERLLKLRATLAVASDPLPKVASAQAVIGNQLNDVLEKLSHSLTEPEASTHNSHAMEVLGKYLLLYRSKGAVSVMMHWIFYFLVLVWVLFVYIGFTSTPGLGTNIEVACVLLVPVLLWNYITRKVDGWLRSRHGMVSPATVTVLPK